MGWLMVTEFHMPYLPAMLVGLVGSALVGIVVERVAYRPLIKSPPFTVILATLAIGLIITNIIRLIWQDTPRTFQGALSAHPLEIGGVLITPERLGIMVALVVVVVLLMAFFRFSRLGKAMRASAQNANAAAIMGINVERVIMITFFIGGALAGAAGMIFGNFLHTGRYLMGFDAGLFAFTAAVFGGIGNITGAMLGGLIIGLIKAFSDQYLAAQWTRAVIFAILILVLVFRPQGLLGQGEAEKA